MVEAPKLPTPLTDTGFWLEIIEGARWNEIDDKALFPAFVDRHADVDPRVLNGIVIRILSLARKTARAIAGRGLGKDRDGIEQIVEKVVYDVKIGLTLPESGLGKGFMESFFGKLVNLTTAALIKLRRRRRISTSHPLVDLPWVGDRPKDDPEQGLLRKDVLRAIDVVATPRQRSTIHLLMSAWTLPETAAIEGVSEDAVRKRINAFLRLYRG